MSDKYVYIIVGPMELSGTILHDEEKGIRALFPVFTNKKKAEKMAGKKMQILKFKAESTKWLNKGEKD